MANVVIRRRSYYLLQNDETKGPYTLGQLRAMWNSGVIMGKTLHRQEGGSEWLPLSTIINELEPPPSPPQYHRPAPERKKKSVSFGIGCLIVLGGLILIAAINSGSVDSSHSSDVGKTTRMMSIKVWFGLESISVQNTGSPDLAGQTMTVYINGIPPFAYKADWTAPAVGETAVIPLSVFIKGGSRFNPTTQAVSEAWIGGAGYDYTAYRKK